jgi:hypothetical protein
MQSLHECTATTNNNITENPVIIEDLATPKDLVTPEDPVLIRVRQNTTNARQRKVRKYEKRHKVTEYTQGDIVAIKLP